VLIDYAGRLGFSPGDGNPFPLEITSNPAQLANDVRSLYDDNYLRAVTAIGQGELLASPLQMAMVVMAVVNEGNPPLPYLVEAIHAPGGNLTPGPQKDQHIGQIMKAETAKLVKQMMISAVEQGSGFDARLPGFSVGGKTGTAQVSGDRSPHSWFTGFALGGDQGVVMAVLIENGGEGSKVAAPIFRLLANRAMEVYEIPAAEVVVQPTPTPMTTEEVPPETPVPTPELIVVDTPVPTPTAAPTNTPLPDSVLAPDIPRNPEKADITAGSASCAVTREGPLGTGEFIWPSQYQALSGDDFRVGHPGIDLAAPLGSPVFAADTGLVTFAGWTGAIGYGNTVLVDHGNGYQTLYAHLSQVSTYCGAKVEKGKLVGLSGNTGNSTGPHLHFEVRVPDGYINPLRVLPTP
jgi:hypothetical protein